MLQMLPHSRNDELTYIGNARLTLEGGGGGGGGGGGAGGLPLPPRSYELVK